MSEEKNSLAIILETALNHLQDEWSVFDKETMEDAHKVFSEGIVKGIKKAGMGLWALSPREEELIMRIKHAQSQIPGDVELKLIAVPKRPDKKSAILGADGKPADGEGSLIITPK